MGRSAKKDLIIIFSIILAVCLVFTALVFVWRYRDFTKSLKESTEEDNVRIAAPTEPLGFKGLNLGMTPEEVDKLSHNRGGIWQLFPGYGSIENRTLLIPLRYKDEIGCEVYEEQRRCFRFTYANIDYYGGKIYKIIIVSNPHSADRINTLKRWLRVAKHGLEEKYGSPKRVRRSTDSINAFDLTARDVCICKWKYGDEEISLMAGENDFEYFGYILFLNEKKAKKKNELKSIDTEF